MAESEKIYIWPSNISKLESDSLWKSRLPLPHMDESEVYAGVFWVEGAEANNRHITTPLRVGKLAIDRSFGNPHFGINRHIMLLDKDLEIAYVIPSQVTADGHFLMKQPMYYEDGSSFQSGFITRRNMITNEDFKAWDGEVEGTLEAIEGDPVIRQLFEKGRE